MATKKRDTTFAMCDRCGCLLPARHLTADAFGTVCASLIRCNQRRLERLATEQVLRDVALRDGVR